PTPLSCTYDDRLEAALHEIEDVLDNSVPVFKRWYAIKLFERDPEISKGLKISAKQLKEVEQLIRLTEKIFDEDSETIIINERYEWLTQLTALCVVTKDSFQLSISDKIDRIVTNRWFALPIFAFVMWFVYYLAIQTIGTIGTDWVNDTLFGGWLPNHIEQLLVEWQVADWMQQLILN